MIVAVDIRDGALVPISSGSGTIVAANGSILTNYHVIFDPKRGKLHDLFVVGLFRAADREPELVCVGNPAKGILRAELDLALIRCNRDRSGAAWQPSGWPTLPIREIDSDAIVPGEQVWVLGYPGVGGSTIHVTAGLVSGFTGEKGAAGYGAFMKTDASITHGNSGGTAIDKDGNFIGVPTAFRLTTKRQGNDVVAAGRVGLIRPLDHAQDLLAVALDPSRNDDSTTDGVVVASRIRNASNGKPIEGAMVIVLRPGIHADEIDLDKLDEQALVWTPTDAAGEFHLRVAPARAERYTVAVFAPGFLAAYETGALEIPPSPPSQLSPWKWISLQPERP